MMLYFKGSLLSPMPGEVVKVVVKEGDSVKQGQLIMVLEAMKMLVLPFLFE